MPNTLVIGIILVAVAWGVDAQASSPQKVARTSGVMTIGGTSHPYHTEGSGVTCIVTGFAPFFPQQFSDRLKQHIRFVYVDFKNSWGAESPRDLQKISMDSLVDEIDQIRTALGLEKVCVVGHSATGFVATEYALRHPDHTSHALLVCVEPFFNQEFRTTHDRFWEKEASAERKKIKQNLDERLPNKTLLSLSPRDSFAMRYVRNGPKYFYDANYDLAWLWIGRHFSMEVLDWYTNTIAKDWDPRPRLARNTVPMFVALGRYDFNVPYLTWESVKKTTPHVTAHVFERSGHFPMMEEPDRFDEALIRWLQGVR
jgi:proline iminopeptidase